ncbi:response regulator [Candidatus Ventrimonas sp. KK005]
MYRIAICDDNEEILEIIKGKIQSYCKKNDIGVIVSEFSDSELILEYIENKKIFDAYFLDIEMPKYTGMDIANNIQTHGFLSYIIYLTAYDNYAIEACHMNTFWYLRKDKMDSQLNQVLDKLFAALKKQKGESVYLIDNQRLYARFYVNEIIYAWKNKKNVEFILTEGRKVQERITITQLFDKLKDNMVWLDRGMLLNPYHIQKVGNDYVTMDEDYCMKISLERATRLKNNLTQYWKVHLL